MEQRSNAGTKYELEPERKQSEKNGDREHYSYLAGVLSLLIVLSARLGVVGTFCIGLSPTTPIPVSPARATSLAALRAASPTIAGGRVRSTNDSARNKSRGSSPEVGGGGGGGIRLADDDDGISSSSSYPEMANPPGGNRRGTYLARKPPKLEGSDRFDEAGVEPAPDVDDDDAEGAPSCMLTRDARLWSRISNHRLSNSSAVLTIARAACAHDRR